MGKRLNYSVEIAESVEMLETLEGKQRLALFRDRLRYLRSLKSGAAPTQKQASEYIGMSLRQGQRIWQLYKSAGLRGLLRSVVRSGNARKLSAEEMSALTKRLQEDDIQFLHEAVEYVQSTYGKHYSLSGMHYLFKRLKVKKKTGRPRNRQQDTEGRESFKKSILS